MVPTENEEPNIESPPPDYPLNENVLEFISPRNRSAGTHFSASGFGLSGIILSAVIISIAILVNSLLPEPLHTKDLANASNRFIAERAYRNLEQLSSIGPRVVGTYENEVLAVQYLKNEVNRIIANATGANKINLHVQRVSGCFDMTLKGMGVSWCYETIQNVVVKVESPRANESILVNCHFDSVATSPGASDDGLHCASMLEVLRITSTMDKALKRHVVFLFNGAEEDGLLGSHGFITKHKWSQDIVTFINLEACGAGGREALFQTGPSASVLPKIYANSVPYPHGVVIGEELFQSGVIPSDTDFRIFRDFGHLKGLDLAHHQNGYVYHTSSDNISFVSKSVMQHSGDNLLALLFALINYDNLKESIATVSDNAVYFDVFGWFMVCYTTYTAFYVNMVTVILSMYSIRLTIVNVFKGMSRSQICCHFGLDATLEILSLMTSVLCVDQLASFAKRRHVRMLWYSSQWFAGVFYGLPTVFINSILIKLRQRYYYSKLNTENEAYLLIAVLQSFYTFMLLVVSFFGARSIYFLAIMLVPMSVSMIVLHSRVFAGRSVGSKVLWYTGMNFIPLLYVTYLCVQFVLLFIPMTGRTGPIVDSEIVIGMSCCVIVFFLSTTLTPFVLLVRNWWKVQLSAGVLYFIFVLVVMYGSVLESFKDNTPERFIVLHVERKLLEPAEQVTKDVSSGYLVIPLDMQAPHTVTKLLRKEKLKQLRDSCSSRLFCGVPSMYMNLLPSMEHSYWTEREKPNFPQSKRMAFKVDETMYYKTFTIDFSDNGLTDLLILPLNNAYLIEWSILPGTPTSEILWQGQPVYIVRRSRGLKVNSGWSITLKFDISGTPDKTHVFKLVWSIYHRTNNTNHYTPKFQKFVEKFPSWTRVVSWVNDYEEYVF